MPLMKCRSSSMHCVTSAKSLVDVYGKCVDDEAEKMADDVHERHALCPPSCD